jgi:hypothetical protein
MPCNTKKSLYKMFTVDCGVAADCTIVKPPLYTPYEFDGLFTDYYIDKNIEASNTDAKKC